MGSLGSWSLISYLWTYFRCRAHGGESFLSFASCLHCLRLSLLWVFAFDPFSTHRCQGLWKQLKINLENSKACFVAVVKHLLLRTVAVWDLRLNFLASCWRPSSCWSQPRHVTAFGSEGLRFDVVLLDSAEVRRHDVISIVPRGPEFWPWIWVGKTVSLPTLSKMSLA